MSCTICHERLTSPASLPCGHVFCRECLRRTVDSVKSASVQHYCPACRKPYNVVTIDPALVPPYLRPHIQSAIRPLFFDESAHSPSTSLLSQPSAFVAASPESQPSAFVTASPSSQSQSPASTSQTPPPTTPSPGASPSTADLGRTAAEADALRLACATWRRRAEIHAAANTGLLGFARAAKECAVRMRTERDAARSCCALLKRKLAELEHDSAVRGRGRGADSGSGSAWSDSDADSPLEEQEVRAGAPAPRGLPVFVRMQQQQRGAVSSPGYDERTQSRFGPPIKRRRVAMGSCPTAMASVPAIPVAGGRV
ncbi:hypothetical protein B0H19DRAFT_1258017 [Mycena capillaripes]|nr:hypothetical protein B0H19DRAFT_1258017 [Mycena capillaripes]